MDYLIITFKIIASFLLVLISIYSAVYFTQINKIEKQFGLNIPKGFKKILGALTMVPMAISLLVLVIIIAELIVFN